MINLEKNKEYNILFSDMDDTLINVVGSPSKEDVEAQIKKLSNIFNNLSSNNIIVIISSLNHPDYPFTKAELFYKYLSKQINGNVLYFFSKAKDYFGEYSSNIYMIGDIRTFLVQEKEEAVDAVMYYLKRVGINIKDIYGLGNGVDDVDMLLKIKKLGGYTGLIEDKIVSNFYFPNLSEINEDNIDEVIHEMTEYENFIETNFIMKKIENRKRKTKDNIPIWEEPELLGLKEIFDNRRKQIKEDFLSSKISKEDLYKRTWIAYLTKHSIAFKEFNDENGIYDIDKAEKYVDNVASLANNFSVSVVESSGLELGGPTFFKRIDNGEKKA